MITFSCESCSAINATSAKFCNNCGASLVKFAANNAAHQSGTADQRATNLDNGSFISEFVFAGFWKRVVAYFIDGLLFTLAFMIILAPSEESLLALQSGDPTFIENSLQLYGYFFIAWWLYANSSLKCNFL